MNRPGPVYKLLVEIADLPPGERRKALLPRLEHIWELSLGQTYLNKRGEEIACPDKASMLRVVEVMDAMFPGDGEQESKGGKLAALKMFDGGKKAG